MERAEQPLPRMSPEEFERSLAESRVKEREQRRKEDFERRWHGNLKRMGSLYSKCTFENYALSEDPNVAGRQREVIASLRKFIDERSMTNLIAFGSIGTGKDHLLAAMIRIACGARADVHWVNGVSIFSELIDAMRREDPEDVVMEPWLEADILAISDPLPPWGELTQFQATKLFQIVDERYRRQRPIWVTMNTTTRAEAERRLGTQVMDRLRDKALCVFFDWPSYRSPARTTKEG